MRADIHDCLTETVSRYPELEPLLSDIEKAYEMLIQSFDQGGQLLLCGNGGSASDCEHIAGELLKGFRLPRHLPQSDKIKMAKQASAENDVSFLAALDRLQLGLPAIPLVSQAAIHTAVANDLGCELVFAQQVIALGCPGDVLLGISTSGNAKNVQLAIQTARALGLKTLGMTGADGGLLRSLTDLCLCVPAEETAAVQELHLPVYHTLCAMIEQYYFS